MEGRSRWQRVLPRVQGWQRDLGQVQIDYSVYRNGKFAHAQSYTSGPVGGVLVGCSFTTSPVSLPKMPIIPLMDSNQQLGWLVEVGGICGNTSSFKYHLILAPTQPRYKGAPLTYSFRQFVAKYHPIVRRVMDKTEIWFVYQEWGNGGTSSMFGAS